MENLPAEKRRLTADQQRRILMTKVVPRFPRDTRLTRNTNEINGGWDVAIPGFTTIRKDSLESLIQFAVDFDQVNKLKIMADQVASLSRMLITMMEQFDVHTEFHRPSRVCEICGHEVSHAVHLRRHDKSDDLPSLYEVCILPDHQR